MTEIIEISQNICFGGKQKRFKHYSEVNQCEMTFSIFLPPQVDQQPAPVLYWLSGLTCTDENFVQKAGAQRIASELGLIIVCPDTSPRGTDVPDDPQGSWDFGLGAGFYVNATVLPWSKHYNMFDYVNQELPGIIKQHFPINDNQAISGHSMGGHGALISAFKQPGAFASVSAFAPITNPILCPWGIKAFNHYLGSDSTRWSQYDACELLKQGVEPLPVMVDQGSSDAFLTEQLKINSLEKAAQDNGFPIDLSIQEGYDHSYFFIASFIEKHLRFHAKHLGLSS
ncbi:S-formylglutathione hydrolase YeiG [Thalassocella blandensis]|nr:S-formylglutathione hydrolase YeiG [Thalassocella blandensis]